MRICLSFLAMMLPAFASPSAGTPEPPMRIEPLDSLAGDIATLGYIPSGGYFAVLAAASGWFGPLSGVRLLPADSEELKDLIECSSGGHAFYGLAALPAGGDMVAVTAPPPVCYPRGVVPAVPVGGMISFSLEGFGNLKEPEVAAGTPDMKTIILSADTSGVFTFRTKTRGVYWFEVMQDTENGPSIELLFPVVSGGNASDVFEGRIRPVGSDAGSPQEIFMELNAARTASGVPPLVRSPRLDSVAGIRAGNLALSGAFTHIDSEAGSLFQLIPSGVDTYGENIGKGKGYQEAWSMILISPFHLRTCLSPDYSSVGMAGAVESCQYEWQLVLVQVFAGGGLEE